MARGEYKKSAVLVKTAWQLAWLASENSRQMQHFWLYTLVSKRYINNAVIATVVCTRQAILFGGLDFLEMTHLSGKLRF